MPIALPDRSELAMVAAFLREGIAAEPAVYELSVPRLPPQRRFVVAAGIDRFIRGFSELRFDEAQLPGWGEGPAGEMMQSWLRAFRFAGELDAVAEGTLVFDGEAIVRVEGGLAEVHVLASALSRAIHAETEAASSAARAVLAAEGRAVVEVGANGCPPADAPWVARAAWIAGCVGSTCEGAAQRFGVPLEEAPEGGALDARGIARRALEGATHARFGVSAADHSVTGSRALEMIYEAVDGPSARPRRGRSQVWRLRGEGGVLREDVLGLADEAREGEVLLRPVLRRGKLLAELPSPRDAARVARDRAMHELARLPASLRRLDLDADGRYHVLRSDRFLAAQGVQSFQRS